MKIQISHYMELKEMSNILPSILEELILAAIKKPLTTQRHSFGGGMKIDVLLSNSTAGEVLSIQISRPKVEPSEVEWQTVLKYLPFSTPMYQDPKRFKYNDRCYIRASWLYNDLAPEMGLDFTQWV